MALRGRRVNILTLDRCALFRRPSQPSRASSPSVARLDQI
jgi:hypothetical protein